MTFPKDLGMVSAKYESGGKGVDFVSEGNKWGDPGGDSYGVHQLSGAYSMGAFLRSEWGKPYARHFAGHKPATPAFNRIYKKVAQDDMDAFGQAQKLFYATTHFVPLRDYAAQKGFMVSDRGVMEALFSMSVQHGGAKKIIAAIVANGVPAGPRSQIEAMYKERSDYVMGLRTLSSRIKSNIVDKRYKNEVKDALVLAGHNVAEKQAADFIPEKYQKPMISGPLFGFLSLLVSIASIFTPKPKPPVTQEYPSDGTEIEQEGVLEADTTVPWMQTAEALINTKEVPGTRNNPTIMTWAKRLGGSTKNVFTGDSVPWCGLYIAHCFNDVGIKLGFDNPLGARNWLKFGKKCDPKYGAVMVFWRGKRSGWTGHVAFYISEDATTYHVLGGNQSDAVNIMKIAKNRFLGARWPEGYEAAGQNAKPIQRKFDGKLSTNEA